MFASNQSLRKLSSSWPNLGKTKWLLQGCEVWIHETVANSAPSKADVLQQPQLHIQSTTVTFTLYLDRDVHPTVHLLSAMAKSFSTWYPIRTMMGSTQSILIKADDYPRYALEERNTWLLACAKPSEPALTDQPLQANHFFFNCPQRFQLHCEWWGLSHTTDPARIRNNKVFLWSPAARSNGRWLPDCLSLCWHPSRDSTMFMIKENFCVCYLEKEVK